MWFIVVLMKRSSFREAVRAQRLIGRIRKIERRAIDDGTVKLPPLIKYQEELSSIGAVVASVLVTCGVLDSKEFGDKSGGVWDSTVVAAELDGEDDDAAADGIDGKYVEKVYYGC